MYYCNQINSAPNTLLIISQHINLGENVSAKKFVYHTGMALSANKHQEKPKNINKIHKNKPWWGSLNDRSYAHTFIHHLLSWIQNKVKQFAIFPALLLPFDSTWQQMKQSRWRIPNVNTDGASGPDTHMNWLFPENFEKKCGDIFADFDRKLLPWPIFRWGSFDHCTISTKIELETENFRFDRLVEWKLILPHSNYERPILATLSEINFDSTFLCTTHGEGRLPTGSDHGTRGGPSNAFPGTGFFNSFSRHWDAYYEGLSPFCRSRVSKILLYIL